MGTSLIKNTLGGEIMDEKLIIEDLIDYVSREGSAESRFGKGIMIGVAMMKLVKGEIDFDKAAEVIRVNYPDLDQLYA